jgi:hypothetical protein
MLGVTPFPSAHHAGGLFRQAKRAIVRAARKVGLTQTCELEPAIRGKTRTYHVDLKICREPQFIHHILVLPEMHIRSPGHTAPSSSNVYWSEYKAMIHSSYLEVNHAPDNSDCCSVLSELPLCSR